MAAWGSPRFLAPAALIASLLAVVVVIAISGSDLTAPGPSRSPAATTAPATDEAKRTARTYVVKAGDNLTVIAEKTGVDVEELERLNPELDPQALLAGERIKLAP